MGFLLFRHGVTSGRLRGYTVVDFWLHTISDTPVSDRRLPWYQRLAAVESLQHDNDSYAFLLLNISHETNHLVRKAMLVAAALAASTNNQIAEVIRKGISDSDQSIQATSVWLSLEFAESGVNASEFNGFNIHRQMLPQFAGVEPDEACYIKNNLSRLYGVTIPQGFSFREVFTSEYDHVVEQLRRAQRYFETDPVAYITAIDNFNHILSIRLSEDINKLSIPRDQYGNILKKLNSEGHSGIAIHFQRCHELRSNSQGPHPWATSLGNWSQTVTHQEKNRVVKELAIAYQSFVDVFASYLKI